MEAWWQSRWRTIGGGLLLAALSVGGLACDEVRCGDGTHEEAGRCVSNLPVNCTGPNVVFQDGVCQARPGACGAGTMFDAEQGRCVLRPEAPNNQANNAANNANNSSNNANNANNQSNNANNSNNSNNANNADPCEGVVCDDPGTPCLSASGRCEGGACVYDPVDFVPCEDGDLCTINFCRGGACMGSAVECDDPPTDRCRDATTLLRVTRPVGECAPASGECDYGVEEVACLDGCLRGACNTTYTGALPEGLLYAAVQVAPLNGFILPIQLEVDSLAPAELCEEGTDCPSSVCAGGVCAPATCMDGVMNGAETDVDCGGSCAPCASGRPCLAPMDCAGGACTAGLCVPVSCRNSMRDSQETGIDCGGPACLACPTGGGCVLPSDCLSGACMGSACVDGCSDGAQGGAETGLDCGGPLCNSCPDGQSCVEASDCASGACVGGVCVTTCADGVMNGAETGLDCGGTCRSCACEQPMACAAGVMRTALVRLAAPNGAVSPVLGGASWTPVDSFGNFEMPFAPITLPGQFLPTGNDVVVQIALEGTVRSPELMCGDVSGQIVTLGAPLNGSTFGAVPWEERATAARSSCSAVARQPLPRIAACPTLSAGVNSGFMSGGLARTFEVVLPATWSAAQTWPVVFAWHGFGHDMDQLLEEAGLRAFADSHEVILVVPRQQDDASAGGEAWDVFTEAAYSVDITFFDDMLRCVSETWRVDPAQVYVTGFSFGGLMTGALLSQRADVIAAAAPFSGALVQGVPGGEYKAPVLVGWGGPTDLSFDQDFDALAGATISALTAAGHIVVACEHGMGHDIDAAFWPWALRFLLDHPRDRAEGDPYMGALPGEFPDFCTIP